MDITFKIDIWALIVGIVIALIAYFLSKKSQDYQKPSFLFSQLPSVTKNTKTRLFHLPDIFYRLALFSFLLAFIDPHFYLPKTPEAIAKEHQGIPTEGIAIYLLLDQSGSMAEQVTATIDGNRQIIPKEDLLKQVTSEFVMGRPNDLMGLIAFARIPQILSPLTLDHQEILQEISQIQVVKKQDEDGTAMGYAIFKAVSMIAATKHYASELAQKGSPSYDIKSSIIILVTDGLQDPSILDKDSRLRNIGLQEAGEFAKQNDVRIYMINIDPNTYSSELAPQRHQMEKMTTFTGGQLFIVNDPGDLAQIYAKINQIEKSVLPQEGLSKDQQPNLYQRMSLYPYFIGFGMLLVSTAFLLRTTIFRRSP